MSGKIAALPNTKISPQTLLAQVMEDVDNIKSVVVILQYKDESFDALWSAMSSSQLCLASFALTMDVQDHLNDTRTKADPPREGS